MSIRMWWRSTALLRNTPGCAYIHGVGFMCKHKTYLLHLILRLILHLSETKEHAQCWKLRTLANNTPIWTLDWLEAKFLYCAYWTEVNWIYRVPPDEKVGQWWLVVVKRMTIRVHSPPLYPRIRFVDPPQLILIKTWGRQCDDQVKHQSPVILTN